MSAPSTMRDVWIARGVLVPQSGSGEQSPPGNAATITIFDSTGGATAPNAVNNKQFNTPLPFERLVLVIDSSHDSGASGVIIEGSTNNGSTWVTMQAAQTYLTANGPTTYDILVTMPQVRLRYTNSAAVPTRWNMALKGVFLRDKGA